MLKNLSTYVLLFLLLSCSDQAPIPKPVGYFRIDLPEQEYKTKELDCPFKIEISNYAYLEVFQENPCWFNIVYPDINAKIHITYKPIDDNLRYYIEESRNFAFEHQIKANKINSNPIVSASRAVYGLSYNLGGNVASPYQFYLTDSVNHFLRGSLYFEARPNQDSISPALEYIKEDMNHLIDSFSWEEN